MSNWEEDDREIYDITVLGTSFKSHAVSREDLAVQLQWDTQYDEPGEADPLVGFLRAGHVIQIRRRAE